MNLFGIEPDKPGHELLRSYALTAVTLKRLSAKAHGSPPLQTFTQFTALTILKTLAD